MTSTGKRNEMFLGNYYIYIGGAEWIRVYTGIRQWDKLMPGELIEGKKYKTTGAAFSAPGNYLIKENPELKVEDSWKYYSYCTIINEFEQEIYIEEVYLKEIENI
jgi:hypothetical protein